MISPDEEAVYGAQHSKHGAPPIAQEPRNAGYMTNLDSFSRTLENWHLRSWSCFVYYKAQKYLIYLYKAEICLTKFYSEEVCSWYNMRSAYWNAVLVTDCTLLVCFLFNISAEWCLNHICSRVLPGYFGNKLSEFLFRWVRCLLYSGYVINELNSVQNMYKMSSLWFQFWVLIIKF